MRKELIARVEGHGRIDIKIKDRHVASVELDILTPPRLFEKLIVGRHFSDVPTIVSRICSICSASHRIVSVMAAETAFGVTVSKETKLLRELLLHGELLESHGLHLFLLALPDHYGKNSFVELSKEMPEVVSLGFKIKGLGNKIQEVAGGRAIHQITPVVGGMSAVPSKMSIELILQTAEPLVEEVTEFLKEIPIPEYTSLVEVKNWVSLSGKEYGYLGDHVLVNTKEKVRINDFWKRFNESALPPSYSKHTLCDNEPFMVGAFPRLLNSGAKLTGRASGLLKHLDLQKNRNPYTNSLAQGIEIVFSLEKVIEIASVLLHIGLPDGQGILSGFKPKAGKGAAAIEAPRGLLVHTYTFDDKGYVVDGNIVTPTALNLADMERNLKIMAEALLKETTDIKPALETLIRAYDPCISCSVHVVSL
jgi:sulfhydrogenase subunit alpha